MAASTVRPFDTLSVGVLREPDLTQDAVIVGADGSFMMPLIGQVQASGRTPEQIAGDIRDRLAARYLVNPNVAVNIAERGSHIVTLDGAVDDPGVYQFVPGTTLMGAIALANGTQANVAKLNEIAVFRTIDGQPHVAVFDLKEIRAGHAADPLIEPGDRVVVGFSQMGEGLENFLRTVPLIGVFSRF